MLLWRAMTPQGTQAAGSREEELLQAMEQTAGPGPGPDGGGSQGLRWAGRPLLPQHRPGAGVARQAIEAICRAVPDKLTAGLERAPVNPPLLDKALDCLQRPTPCRAAEAERSLASKR